MDNIQYITLDILNNKCNEYAYTKQYDVGRKLIFSFTEDGKIIDLANWGVIFSLKKPDGYIIVEIEAVSLEDNTVEVTLTDQMTILSGLLPYQLSLINQEGVLVSTVTSYLLCDAAPVQLEDVESQSSGSYVVGNIVTYEPTLTEGTEIGSITIDGTLTKLYAPDTSGYQPLLMAGDNIDITDNTISATDTTYTAGTNVSIENNVISATDTTYTAGHNITITDGEISAADAPTVSVTQIESSGTNIADITVGDTTTHIYAPSETTVIANPSGTATTDLTKLQVDNTIYKIPAPSHDYSATEHVVGTWIDGNTLYEKTIVFDADTSQYEIDLSSLSIDSLISESGYVIHNDNSYWIHMPYYENSVYKIDTNFERSTGKLILYFGSSMLQYYHNGFITIQYTKSV